MTSMHSNDIRSPINLQSDALLAIERLARNGHGLWFSQTSAGASYRHVGIGSTTEEFCAAVIELEAKARD